MTPLPVSDLFTLNLNGWAFPDLLSTPSHQVIIYYIALYLPYHDLFCIHVIVIYFHMFVCLFSFPP